MSKYGNKKTVIDGITFDSRKEGIRYKELKLMEKAKLIHGLQRQVPFVLIKNNKKDDGSTERKCTYYADFTYYDKNNNYVVEDVKGKRTKEYIIKRKLMLDRLGITIKEI